MINFFGYSVILIVGDEFINSTHSTFLFRLYFYSALTLFRAEFLINCSFQIEPLHQFEMKVGPTITDDDRLFLVSLVLFKNVGVIQKCFSVFQ